MARAQLTNNASALLASGISNVATSLTVASGKGALFPAPGANYFYATITEGALIENVKCTARTTDTLTITRAQEGTSAQTFTSAATIKLNLTAAVLAELASKTDTETLTNKTIALGSNTVSGTIAQFNTAVTDADLATLAGTETLTGKTVNLTSNTLSGTTAQFNTALSDGDFATLAGTETMSGKTLTAVSLRETKVAMGANDINLATGNAFTKTISGATTLTVSNVPSTGNFIAFILDLTNGGSATITWWSGMKWAGGAAPSLTAAGRDVMGFLSHDGGTTWTGMLLCKGAA